MKKNEIFFGLASTLTVLSVLSIAATHCACENEFYVNNLLGVTNSHIENPIGSKGTVFYPSEFGSFNAENQLKLTAATKGQCMREEAEGAVLLRNENGSLPLKASERNVTFFGRAVVDPVYRCSSSGNYPEAGKMSEVVDAFESSGFRVNKTLIDAYRNSGIKRKMETGNNEIGEVPFSFYDETLRSSYQTDYNDLAIIFLARESAEGVDFMIKDKEGISQLGLHDDEKKMVQMVSESKKKGIFKKIIVLLNTPTPMETGWLEDYGIDACLDIGLPGQWGASVIPGLLTGENNPCGSLTDTYAASSLSAPSVVNASYNSPRFLNADELRKAQNGKYGIDYLTVYAEGIYVGYKYYETRYEDCVEKRYGADSSVGSSDGLSWDYRKEVAYPFGYGLSYTQFIEAIDGVTFDAGKDVYAVNVKVTNTGAVAGKTAVKIFAQTPYGGYEIMNKVEKPAVNLVGFEKTGVVEASATVDVTVSIPRYFLSSYDYCNAKGYVLSAGEYYLSLGNNAHDAINNILADKGMSSLFFFPGDPSAFDGTRVYKFNQKELDAVSYKHSPAGKEVTNAFSDCDLNHFVKNGVTYLSRSDWEHTFPITSTSVAATDEMIRILQGNIYENPDPSKKANDYKQGAKNNLKLLDMRGVSYDDPKWEEYLNQLYIDEMKTQPIDSFSTPAIPSVIKGEIKVGDGMDSISGRLAYGDRPKACLYTSSSTLASSWDKGLSKRRGELMGEELLFSNAYMSYSVGGNLHRTPFGGRNFEYPSEDGNLGYCLDLAKSTGFSDKGTIGAIKHVAGNDQEFQRNGIATMFNEQSFRENDLRVFEGAVKEGKSLGLMESYNRVGLTWSSASYALGTTVLREEWGFQGMAITDAATIVDYKGRYEQAFYSGTDIFCLDSNKSSGPSLANVIQQTNDGTLMAALRRAVKDNHFAYVNSAAINGMNKDSYVVVTTPWWKVTLISVSAGLSLAAVGLLALSFVFDRKEMKSL